MKAVPVIPTSDRDRSHLQITFAFLVFIVFVFFSFFSGSCVVFFKNPSFLIGVQKPSGNIFFSPFSIIIVFLVNCLSREVFLYGPSMLYTVKPVASSRTWER